MLPLSTSRPSAHASTHPPTLITRDPPHPPLRPPRVHSFVPPVRLSGRDAASQPREATDHVPLRPHQQLRPQDARRGAPRHGGDRLAACGGHGVPGAQQQQGRRQQRRRRRRRRGRDRRAARQDRRAADAGAAAGLAERHGAPEEACLLCVCVLFGVVYLFLLLLLLCCW